MSTLTNNKKEKQKPKTLKIGKLIMKTFLY